MDTNIDHQVGYDEHTASPHSGSRDRSPSNLTKPNTNPLLAPTADPASTRGQNILTDADHAATERFLQELRRCSAI